ncbi:hypothetical protein Acr_18g0009550 [Actinidia rufa]|uniref:Uncharacterized protein n=1 Tax=Actinidia rufa TaxID=165716 RepID=A0A7J0G7K5_9ERIC|nr:hypothetical protein Acr_18g0009550 [Actinidia rufa]
MFFNSLAVILKRFCSQQPIERAIDKETWPYQKWKKADDLASMSNVLQHQHQAMPTAYDMMMSLKEMLRDQNLAARLVAMRDLMNTTMVEGTPFFLNYNMNKFSCSMAELLKKLQAAEGLIKKPIVALVTEKCSTSKPKGKKKQKKVQKQKATPQAPHGSQGGVKRASISSTSSQGTRGYNVRFT